MPHVIASDAAFPPTLLRTYACVVRYVRMHEEMVSTDNKLDMAHAHVKTWNGRSLPIELCVGSSS